MALPRCLRAARLALKVYMSLHPHSRVRLVVVEQACWLEMPSLREWMFPTSLSFFLHFLRSGNSMYINLCMLVSWIWSLMAFSPSPHFYSLFVHRSMSSTVKYSSSTCCPIALASLPGLQVSQLSWLSFPYPLNVRQATDIQLPSKVYLYFSPPSSLFIRLYIWMLNSRLTCIALTYKRFLIDGSYQWRYMHEEWKANRRTKDKQVNRAQEPTPAKQQLSVPSTQSLSSQCSIQCHLQSISHLK